MREKHFDGVARRAGECCVDVLLVRVASRGIGHAGDDEFRVAVLDYAMLVLEKSDVEARDLFHPFAGAPVVFMIACDEVDAVARGEIAKRRDLFT